MSPAPTRLDPHGLGRIVGLPGTTDPPTAKACWAWCNIANLVASWRPHGGAEEGFPPPPPTSDNGYYGFKV